MLTLASLAAELKKNLADFSTIFQEKLADGFGIKSDPLFTLIQANDEVPLVRDFTAAILQPGRKGTTNFTSNAVGLANRTGKIRPFKADLKLDEQTIYSWSKQYLSYKGKKNQGDIYSFAGMDYIMSRIMKRAGRDILSVIFSGVYNPSGTSVNDIADGLKIHFTQGVATSGPGFVGDIPAANVITAATTINQSNVIAEISKFVDKMAANVDFPKDENGTLCMDEPTFVAMTNAVASALSNGQAIVSVTNGVYKLAAYPNITIEKKNWLTVDGVAGKMLLTTHGNLVIITPEIQENENVSSIEVEQADRNLKIFVDGEIAFNYIDGRYILLNSKVIA